MKRLNKFIDEMNSVIKELFRNKVFLLYIIVAITILILGSIVDLENGKFIDLVIAVTISLCAAINYYFAYKSGDSDKKMKAGLMLFIVGITSMFIGYLIFYRTGILSPKILYNKIANSSSHIYLLCITATPIVVVLMKIVLKSGKALTGGIVSGHAAYATSVLIITADALSPFHFFISFLLIPSLLVIIISRCKYASHLGYRAILSVSVIASILNLTVIYHCISQKAPAILILSQIILIALVLRTIKAKPTHREREIFLGIAIGLLIPMLIIAIFHP